ncbi:T-cell receptor beta chain V region [Aquarana catesbeiana]|nr:T-cell receptor beta chain V region [Aquarana catesbeiana]
MKRLLCLLLVFEPLAHLCQAVTVTQNVPIIITKTGKKVEIPCAHDDTTGAYNMYWYQQKPGDGLKLMAVSIGVSTPSMENKFEREWSMSRPDTTNSLLTKEKAKPEDTAVYFCASGMHSHK